MVNSLFFVLILYKYRQKPILSVETHANIVIFNKLEYFMRQIVLKTNISQAVVKNIEQKKKPGKQRSPTIWEINGYIRK